MFYELLCESEEAREEIKRVRKATPELAALERELEKAHAKLKRLVPDESWKALDEYEDARNAEHAAGDWCTFIAGMRFTAQMLLELFTP